MILLVLGASCENGGASPAAVRAAVAGNFALPFEELSQRFTEETGVGVEVVVGSTGQLYAQIRNGAPFDVFLAADTVRPARLEAEGMTVAGSRGPYAIGRLVLYAPGWDSVQSVESELRQRRFRHLAIANPRTAPYGEAARAVLVRWGLWERLAPSVVRGENVMQAYQFVVSGAAEAGLIALAHVVHEPRSTYAMVPASVYAPIRQDVVVMRTAADLAAADALAGFLRGPLGRTIIRRFGYDVP